MADPNAKNSPPSIVGGPVTPPKRPTTHVEKARAILGPVKPETVTETGGIKKLTARVTGEQFDWLADQAKGYKLRHPKRGRVTIEELVSVMIEHLREAPDLDAVIAKHRS